MQKDNLEMLWLWGELPQAAKVSSPLPATRSILPCTEGSFEKHVMGTVLSFKKFYFIFQCVTRTLNYIIILQAGAFFFFLNNNIVRSLEDATASCIPSKSL